MIHSCIELFPAIKPYAWGGQHFIANWLGLTNADQKPMAEAWYGDHSGGSARFADGTTLTNWIRDHAEVLGEESIRKYGRHMPFLLKIMDIQATLSLQVHPTTEQAQIGYDRENKAGLPLADPKRNYKDPYHKPELILALSDLWLLQGFETTEIVRQRFADWMPHFEWLQTDDWNSLVHRIWNLTDAECKIHADTISTGLQASHCILCL
jgi:mannose-6-phosphate isomerase class I